MKNHQDTNRDNLENLFQERLFSYQEDPGDAMWDRLEPNIPPVPGSLRTPKIYWASGAVAACLILFLGVSLFHPPSSITKTTIADTNINDFQIERKTSQIQEILVPVISQENILDNNIALNITPQKSKQDEEKANPTILNINSNTNHISKTTFVNHEPVNNTDFNSPLPIHHSIKEEKTQGQAELQPLAYQEKNTIVQLRPFEVVEDNVSFDRKKGQGWFIGASVQPQLVGRVYSMDSSMETKIKAEETMAIASDFGLRVGYEFNDNWSVYSGIRLENRRSDINYNEILSYQSDIETMNEEGDFVSQPWSNMESMAIADGVIQYDLIRSPNAEMEVGDLIPIHMKTSFRERELEIPLVGEFSIKKNKFKLSAKAGLVGNVLLSEGMGEKEISTGLTGVRIDDAQLLAYQAPHKFTMDYLVGAGVSYQVKDHWNVFVEPTFEARLGSPTTTKIGSKYQYALGLETGLAYKF